MPKVLGSTTDYPESYSPHLLEGIPRSKPRKGVDIWTCYEVSWCEPSGKPQVAIVQMSVPANSPNIVESKSLKLYLNSFNNERLTQDEFEKKWAQDVGSCVKADIQLTFFLPDQWQNVLPVKCDGTLIDHLEPEPNKDWIESDEVVSESLYTHLFRSLCPVTSQPDWATLEIKYTGKKISEQKLLYELTHQRNKQGFHESCVEELFDTIQNKAECNTLTVTGYFTRRGGIDITPIRTTESGIPDWKRQVRQ